MRIGCFIAAVFFVAMCGAELRQALRYRVRCGRWLSFQIAGSALWACFAAVAFYAALGPE